MYVMRAINTYCQFFVFEEVLIIRLNKSNPIERHFVQRDGRLGCRRYGHHHLTDLSWISMDFVSSSSLHLFICSLAGNVGSVWCLQWKTCVCIQGCYISFHIFISFLYSSSSLLHICSSLLFHLITSKSLGRHTAWNSTFAFAYTHTSRNAMP